LLWAARGLFARRAASAARMSGRLPRLQGWGPPTEGLYSAKRASASRTKVSALKQIAASIAVALVVMALVVWGLLWAWHYIKRYRLAIGFAGLTVGFGIIRFISLHEVDAWNANAPWARTAVDLVAAAGVAAIAIARLWQLRTSEQGAGG
jgi:hypothetical protein